MPHRHSLAFAAGLASATGFAPLGFWPLTLGALALLIALIEQAPNRRAALLTGYCFGFGHFVVGLNWIAGAFRYQDTMPVWLGWVAVVLLSLYLAVFPAVAAGLAWVWGRTRPIALVLVFAGGWIVTEWLRARLFTGFAWNPLAAAVVDAAAASGLIGTYGVSGLVILLGGVVWLGLRWHWAAAGGILVAVLALAGLGWGNMQAREAASHATAKDAGYWVRVVQPNIAQQDKHDERFNAINFSRLEGQMKGGAPGPRLIFWPEAAVPEHIGESDFEAELARARIVTLLAPQDVLLLGNDKIFAERFMRDGELYERWVGAANSVFAMDAHADLRWRYDKAHLVPYGEYLPARTLLSAIGLSRLVPGDLDFWPGPGPKSFALPGFGKAGVQICYEIIFSGNVVDAANRPDFVFNPSNDAWFGSWGPPQHLAQARLRAMEEGIPVIRSTPTGISAVIDARGVVLKALPYQKAGYIEARMPLPHAPTLFSRWGNSLPLALAMILGALGIALSRRND